MHSARVISIYSDIPGIPPEQIPEKCPDRHPDHAYPRPAVLYFSQDSVDLVGGWAVRSDHRILAVAKYYVHTVNSRCMLAQDCRQLVVVVEE